MPCMMPLWPSPCLGLHAGTYRRDSTCCKCRDERLLGAAVAVGLPIADVPAPVSRLLLQHSVHLPQLLTPALLRKQLVHHSSLALAACKVCVVLCAQSAGHAIHTHRDAEVCV